MTAAHHEDQGERSPVPVARVHLPSSLVALFPGTPRRLEVPGSTVADVLDELNGRVPGLRDRLVESGPAIRPHINIYVAGERADLSTPIPPGAALHVVPAVSGGASEEVDPREAARIRRRDREAEAERRALLQPGMGKVFKQIQDAQVKAAQDPPPKRRRRAPG